MTDDEPLVIADLQRLAQATVVPPAEPAREAALLQAFDRVHSTATTVRVASGYGWLAAMAAAAVLLIAATAHQLPAGRAGTNPPPRRGSAAHGAPVGSDARPVRSSAFIPWPGSAALPPLESGQLVRMDLPVAMLPALGVVPPAAPVTAVKADVIVGQDGLARAVRFISD